MSYSLLTLPQRYLSVKKNPENYKWCIHAEINTSQLANYFFLQGHQITSDHQLSIMTKQQLTHAKEFNIFML